MRGRRYPWLSADDLALLAEQLPANYIAAHVEHAYALTAHASQGATVERAQVVGTPEDFTNEWAYTALSRARDPVTVHLIAEAADRTNRAGIAPVPPDRPAEEAIHVMRAAMCRREREELAIEQLAREQALTERAPVAGEAAAARRAGCRSLAIAYQGARGCSRFTRIEVDRLAV